MFFIFRQNLRMLNNIWSPMYEVKLPQVSVSMRRKTYAINHVHPQNAYAKFVTFLAHFGSLLIISTIFAIFPMYSMD